MCLKEWDVSFEEKGEQIKSHVTPKAHMGIIWKDSITLKTHSFKTNFLMSRVNWECLHEVQQTINFCYISPALNNTP